MSSSSSSISIEMFDSELLSNTLNSPTTISSSTTSSNSSSIDEEPITINITQDIVPSIKVVQEEKSLVDYTENHFNNRINQDLEKIRKSFNHGHIPSSSIEENYPREYIHSNSPIMSVHGGSSQSNSDNEEIDNNEIMEAFDNSMTVKVRLQRPPHYRYKKLGYRDIERSLDKYYSAEIINKYSTELDILTTYMKGQKNLYIQSKHLTQRKLNCLMFPSLLLSAFITIVAPFFECRPWSVGLISAINAVIALFISMINYLKLESSIEMYLQMANQYDHLETMLELTNSKISFMKREDEISEMALSKIREIEQKMVEIKGYNNILIPEEIKTLFPIICHINIFSFIKKTEIYKKNMIEKFKDVTNEIRYILYKWAREDHDRDHSASPMSSIERTKENARLVYLYDIKNKIKDEIMDFRSTYGFMDDLFSKEIKNAETNKNSWFFFIWFAPNNNKTNIAKYLENANPAILKYYTPFLV